MNPSGPPTVSAAKRSPLATRLNAAIFLGLLPGCTPAAGTPLGGGPCASATAHATLVHEGEPGTPLVVRGRVFRPDGETPAAGVLLYVYQTDATGLYLPREFQGTAPRLRAWLRTGPDGSYEFRTIRPAPYPGQTIAAHIHTQLWSEEFTPQYGPELLFDDDPLVRALERATSLAMGRFRFVARPAVENGVALATLDIRLSTSGSRFEDNTAHGIAACRE